MATSVYQINKGINRPIEFKGLKAQYIGYLGGGLVVLLILFSFLYITGVNMFLCLVIILMLTTLLFVLVYRINAKYGQYGLMKKIARQNIPAHLRSGSRYVFLSLTNKTNHDYRSSN